MALTLPTGRPGGELHGDPGYRLIVATARHLGRPIVARGRRLIAYDGAGHVGIIAR
jgi:PIN domain nuclease of toxin-antitoxin system